MRTKLATLGMSMVVVFALAVEGLAIPYFNQENTNQSGTTTTRRRGTRRRASMANANTGDATASESMTQNANTGRRRGRRGSRRRANANTGDTTTEATPTTTEQATPPATETMTPPATQRRGGRRGGRRMMMSGVPSGVDNCLKHLAQMASSDPLMDYEGHPSQIINNGLLWNNEKSKCAVTDQAQRAKIFELAKAWRMKDATKVRSLLSELGATGTSGTN